MNKIENAIYLLAGLSDEVKEADHDLYVALRREIEVTLDVVVTHLQAIEEEPASALDGGRADS